MSRKSSELLFLLGGGQGRLLRGLVQPAAGELRTAGGGPVDDGRFGFLGFLVVGHRSSLRAPVSLGFGPYPHYGRNKEKFMGLSIYIPHGSRLVMAKGPVSVAVQSHSVGWMR